MSILYPTYDERVTALFKQIVEQSRILREADHSQDVMRLFYEKQWVTRGRTPSNDPMRLPEGF